MKPPTWYCTVYVILHIIMPTRNGPNESTILGIRKDCNLSGVALETILKIIESYGLPIAKRRRTLQRQRRILAGHQAPFGSLLRDIHVPLTDGTSHLSFLCKIPVAWIWVAVQNWLAFRDALLQFLHRCGNRMRFALSSDGVIADNVLASDNGRKTAAIYWTFLGWIPQHL